MSNEEPLEIKKINAASRRSNYFETGLLEDSWMNGPPETGHLKKRKRTVECFSFHGRKKKNEKSSEFLYRPGTFEKPHI